MQISAVEHLAVDECGGGGDDGPPGEQINGPTEKVRGGITDREATDQCHMPRNARYRSQPPRGSGLQCTPNDERKTNGTCGDGTHQQDADEERALPALLFS